MTETHRDYWKKNLRLTLVLLSIWLLVSYVMGWFASSLAEITFFGWPLSFYMAAQGSLIIYIILIGVYAKRMRQLDIEHGVEEGED